MPMRQMWNQMYEKDKGEGCGADAWLVDTLADATPGHALEFGAGTGLNALWLARRGWRVTAIDFADVAVAYLVAQAEAAALPVTAKVADITAYQDARAYDLVYMCYIHLEAEDQRKMLRSSARQLKRGGRMLYIGLTGVTNLPDHVDPASFASARTLAAYLPADMRLVRQHEARRRVPLSADEVIEEQGVLLEAVKL